MPRVIKSQGARNRRAGHTFERTLIKEFKDLGFIQCCSSRSESKNMDDKGIDLCFTDPFQIQAKNVKTSIQYEKTLDRMPKGKGKYNVVIHKKERKQYVIMEKGSFYEIIQMLVSERIIDPQR